MTSKPTAWLNVTFGHVENGQSRPNWSFYQDNKTELSYVTSVQSFDQNVENRQNRTKLIVLEQSYRTLDKYSTDSQGAYVHNQVNFLTVDSRQSELRW